jgi:nicotinamidase-related amidase
MPRSFSLSTRCTALVVVDIQEKLFKVMGASDQARVLRASSILAAAAKEFNLPVILTEQYPQGIGPTHPEIRAHLPGIEPVQKMAFSCWPEPAFQKALLASKAREVILCGIEAHVCVLQTALDLLRAGYKVFVAADGTCSRSQEDYGLALELMRQAGAVLGSSEIFVFQMLGEAGTEPFKRLSRLIR